MNTSKDIQEPQGNTANRLLSFVFAREIQRIADQKLWMYVMDRQRHISDASVIELYGHKIFRSPFSELMYLLLFELQYVKMLKKSGIGLITLYRITCHRLNAGRMKDLKTKYYDKQANCINGNSPSND